MTLVPQFEKLWPLQNEACNLYSSLPKILVGQVRFLAQNTEPLFLQVWCNKLWCQNCQRRAEHQPFMYYVHCWNHFDLQLVKNCILLNSSGTWCWYILDFGLKACGPKILQSIVSSKCQTLIALNWPVAVGQSRSSSLMTDTPVLDILTWRFLISAQRLLHVYFLSHWQLSVGSLRKHHLGLPPVDLPVEPIPSCFILCLSTLLFISRSHHHLPHQSSSLLLTMSLGHQCLDLRSFHLNCQSRWSSATGKGARPERGGWGEDRGERAGGVRGAQDKSSIVTSVTFP